LQRSSTARAGDDGIDGEGGDGDGHGFSFLSSLLFFLDLISSLLLCFSLGPVVYFFSIHLFRTKRGK
jgi:hypothetical protein